MADQSPKPLVDQITAEKVVVAERIEQLIINITLGLGELPTRYDSRVQNFLEYYLGGKDHSAPFGGRASDLAALDAWLDDPAAPSYASLIAPAGRGKSALLAHWVTRLASRSATGAEAVHVVYFPISIRYETNREPVVFASLAARMAHVYGEKVTQAVDAQQYRGVFSDYLRRTPPNGGRVLVVMDGLDEAAGWEAGADLFPTVAPGHLRVIVAARPLALDKDETAWLNRLGWEMPNRAHRISLAGLDREGVRDVLSQMGNPLDALATKIDLISRLYELSAGDPLLVRLYVEALLPQGAQAATLTPEDLVKLQPGLEAYFKRWFEEQQKLWGAAKPLQNKTVRGLLNLCAAALGPLKKDDVLALAPDIFEDSGLLDEAVQAVNRFIIGDGLGSGYVFSHPRLGEYFAGKLTDCERQAWQARFLQYGRDTLTALENKTLLPKNAPAYAVQYYSAHLAQANAPATDFYALLCESWLRAWEWLEGTPTGFLNDADRAWQKAEAEGPAALGQQIRAALCFASVTSLSANIPKDLLVACIKAEVISPALGLVMTRQKPDPEDRAECLAAIAEFQPSESHAIMNEALSAARAISYEVIRAEILIALVPRLPKREQADVLGEALSAARTNSDEAFLAENLMAVAPWLPEHEQVEVLEEALSATRAIFQEESRVRILMELAPRLSEHEHANVLREALSAARAISDEWPRAKILGELAPRLSECEQAEVLMEALATARAISYEGRRAEVLGALASRLPKSEQAKVLEEALIAAYAIPDKESRAYVWWELLPRLPKSLLKEALSIARVISYEALRASTLAELARRLPDDEQAKVLGEALSAARAISDEWSRTKVLGELTPFLPENLLREALSVARTISNEWRRAKVLLRLALRLPESEQIEVLREALSATSTVSDEWFRTSLLKEITLRLSDSMLGRALLAARTISFQCSRTSIGRAFAPRLPKSMLRKTLSAARAIPNEESRIEALMKIVLWLPECEQAVVFKEVLTSARAISFEGFRAEVLGKLTPRLSESLLGEVLQMARTLCHHDESIHVFSNLTTRWPAVCRSTQRTEFEELSATLRAFARTKRPQLLQAIQALLPFIAEQGGLPALRETARAIVDTAKWWP